MAVEVESIPARGDSLCKEPAMTLSLVRGEQQKSIVTRARWGEQKQMKLEVAR